MSVEKKFDSLPKNVQKLVKKLADIQRKELAVLQDETKDDISEEFRVFFEQEDKVIGDLFCTKFAIEEVGLCFPDDDDDFLSDDLDEMGEYFLGLYALDRLYAEENGEKYSEDLFYAGALLKHKAEAAAEEEELYDFDDFDDDPDEENEDINEILDRLFETFGNAPGEPAKKGKKGKQADGKVVPLFGENKDRIQ